MSELIALAGIMAVLSLGTMSPGPSFVVVARTAVAKSRSHGMAAAVGMGVGGIVFAGAALLGLQGLLTAVPSMYFVLKLAGGLYLCFLAFRIIRAATEPMDVSVQVGFRAGSLVRSFLVGLATQVSNPKTAIVYASVFAAFLPNSLTPVPGLMVLIAVFVIEAGWYSIVAIALSATKPRHAYLSYKVWIDRVAGVAMGALGIKLLLSVNKAAP